MNLSHITICKTTIKVFLFIFLFSSKFLRGQEIIYTLSQPNEINNGYVIVTQKSSISMLLERSVSINKANEGNIQGFRIQIFSDYKPDARENSIKQQGYFISLFPDFDTDRIYSAFEPPFIKVRVGDYRDENSALIDYKRFVRFFPDCYIIKATIKYPSID